MFFVCMIFRISAAAFSDIVTGWMLSNMFLDFVQKYLNFKHFYAQINSMDALIEFGKLLIPASVVLYAAYLLVRSFIQKEIDLKKLEIRGRSIETVLPSRLQAYERMALFLER